MRRHPGLISGKWRGSPSAGNRKPPDPSPPEAICAGATAGDTAATIAADRAADLPGRAAMPPLAHNAILRRAVGETPARHKALGRLLSSGERKPPAKGFGEAT